VVALSRGFLVAGARRVVASLWPVDDDATAELVGRLLRGLADVERGSRSESTAAALREAKLAVRHRPGWEHPFFWAPFVLSGAG
jgi:CHAT domain-containing protein